MENSLDLKTLVHISYATNALMLFMLANKFYLMGHGENALKQVKGFSNGLVVAFFGGAVTILFAAIYESIGVPTIIAKTIIGLIGNVVFYYLLRKVI